MLNLVFLLLGILMGQFILLLYFRVHLGYDNWQYIQSFYDALVSGEVEVTEDDDENNT